MIQTARKGRRLEHRSRALLEARGYVVLRSAASKGLWDLVGFGADDAVLVQCKANRAPSPAERAQLQAFVCPWNTHREVHVWTDGARAPEVLALDPAPHVGTAENPLVIRVEWEELNNTTEKGA
jgi:hypothetical protein